MQDFEKLGAFYLGQTYDMERRSRTEDLLLYDSRDLVTHAVCVGMTGSGKTGLCIGLIEEAAIDGVPAILIDPKGDLTNLLLTFPDQRPEDFLPWINCDEARAQGLSDEEYAVKQAEAWSQGLKDWGQDGDRIRRMRDAADFTIFTPRSTAGLPVSILNSFAPPPADVLEDAELRRERVQAAAASILALIGLETQATSREQTFLASIFDCFWREGKSLDLEGLIGAIQRPPFTRLGALDVNSFYPEKERFELAASLNNILASPGFEAWLEGDPLDVDRLLHTREGKPRISIFSIAHLNDHERMFFVTLLLNQMVAWMRTQQGAGSLRALLYMDEIFGFFPPVQNPPAKEPLLTLLKQARAFGLGVVLATQNPVDLDYKGLANAGTWFIGRLQTDRDKQRVLDGLEGAAAAAGAGFERAEMDRLLSALGKRVFLMNNVHENAPAVFQTRWTLSYLRGPLGREQVKKLMAPRKQAPAPKPETAVRPSPATAASGSLPTLPPGVPQFFATAPAGAVMRPMLAGAAQVRFVDVKRKVDLAKETLFLTPIDDGPVPVKWDDAAESTLAATDLTADPPAAVSFEPLPAPAAQPKNYAAWKREFTAWLSASQSLRLYRSPATGAISSPAETEGDFRARNRLAIREARDRAVDDLRRKYAPKLMTLEDRLRRAQQAVEREAQQAQAEKYQSAINVGTTLIGALFGRKTFSATTIGRAGGAVRSMSRARKEAGDVARSSEALAAVQQQYADLQEDLNSRIAELQASFDPANNILEPVEIRPKKTHIAVRLVALVWVPAGG